MPVLTLPLARPAVDPAAFRDAMSQLASGVAVAACREGDAPRGLLVSSLTALSTEPARVLFCVKKTASAHGAFLAAQDCSLNILGQDHRREAERFSTTDLAHERFAPEDWRLDGDRPPEHRGALVRLSGFIDQKIDAGTHSIFILRVGAATTAPQTPLVYFDRAFHRVLPLPSEDASNLEPPHDRPHRARA